VGNRLIGPGEDGDSELVEMGSTQMRKIDAFEEYGVRWTYHVPEKAFRGVENLHGACMMKKKNKKKKNTQLSGR